MFDLEEYKNTLVNYYRWEIDDTEEERQKRREMLKGKDDYLLNIIQSTEEFIYFILTKMQEENKTFKDDIFINLPLESEKNTIYNNSLNLLLHGGWPSDTFFYLEDPTKLISIMLLKQFFQGFHIECDCEDVERYDEQEGIGWTDSYWQVSISGPLKDFNRLYKDVEEAKKGELINTLKRVRNTRI